MDASDFRIGITIKWNGTPKTINNWVELSNATDPSTTILVEPIDISEGMHLGLLEVNYFKIKKIPAGYEVCFQVKQIVFVVFTTICIQYVHELQNLYKGLTGKNLLTLSKL
jgi:hypothetical protein